MHKSKILLEHFCHKRIWELGNLFKKARPTWRFSCRNIIACLTGETFLLIQCSLTRSSVFERLPGLFSILKHEKYWEASHDCKLRERWQFLVKVSKELQLHTCRGIKDKFVIIYSCSSAKRIINYVNNTNNPFLHKRLDFLACLQYFLTTMLAPVVFDALSRFSPSWRRIFQVH